MKGPAVRTWLLIVKSRPCNWGALSRRSERLRLPLFLIARDQRDGVLRLAFRERLRPGDRAIDLRAREPEQLASHTDDRLAKLIIHFALPDLLAELCRVGDQAHAGRA